MEERVVQCKNLNGENGCYCETGDASVSLIAEVMARENGQTVYKDVRFIVHGVGSPALYYAMVYVMYLCCGLVGEFKDVRRIDNN